MKPQFLIGAATSGSGKTTITMGLIRALTRRGLYVRPYKCGPDYIDTQYHAIAANHEAINLDVFMASEAHVQQIYNYYGEKADVCITEGVMGLFDGFNRMKGSSAEIAELLHLPVILIVNAKSTAYSVSPLLYGFKHFRSSVRLAGVIFNQVSSVSHFNYLKEACKDAGVSCFGYVTNSEQVKVSSRHLGLTLSAKQQMSDVIDRVADLVEQTVDLDRLLNACTRIFPCRISLPYSSETGWPMVTQEPNPPIRTIAVARDPAFNFIYKVNLDRLAKIGKLTFFSPVYGSDLPEADLVYLPGGYPELFARQLHRRKRLMKQLRDYAESGGCIFAECGGMMLLGQTLTSKTKGTPYEMAGVLPLDATMEQARLHLGYRRMTLNGVEWKGHEFHYSDVRKPNALPSIAQQYNAKGSEVATPIYRYKNVIAGYTHWYWGETDFLSFWN